MAVKTYRVPGSTVNNSWSDVGAVLVETDVTAATRTDGWTVAKSASGTSSTFFPPGKTAGFTSQATTPKPDPINTNCFGMVSPQLTGTFAATAWTFTFAVRAGTASSQAGRIRMRVYKANSPNAASWTELTTSTQVGTTTSALSTTADVTSVVTWSPGTTFTLSGEYLYFTLAWEITTAGGNNSADVLIRTGQSAGGTRLVTPDLSVSAAASDSVAEFSQRRNPSQRLTVWRS